MKTCPVCKKEISSGSVCENCGYDLSGDFTLLRTLAPVGAAERELLRKNRASAELPPEPKPKKRLWLLALIPLLLLGAYSIAYAVSDGWVRKEYDSVGNVIKETRYNIIGVMDGWIEYGYDSTRKQTVEVEYDSAGNKTKWTRYNGDGSVDYWYEYEYDSAGNVTKETRYNGDGSVDCVSEYDSAGNVTKFTMYNGDGSIAWIHEAT